MDRKAQAGGAASLIAIIAFIIILYIMILPADVREDLLNETTSSTSSRSTSLTRNELIIEHPGTLDPVKTKDRGIALDSFNLYSEKSAVVLKSAETIHVERGWLRNKVYNLSFNVLDLANTENYVLAFDITDTSGRLIITLGGNEIYNSAIPVGNVIPIKLDKDLIKNSNSLIFSVSDTGLAFWRLNGYDLSNVRVIADITDVSKKEYKNFFIVSSTEKENLDKTELQFVPDCLTKRVGPLKILINNVDLHYQVIPDCGTLSKLPFDPAILQQGENSITFRAEEGNYLIDRVAIKTTLKSLNYPFYYFELGAKDFERVANRTANVTVELKFADFEDKQGTININGHLVSMITSNSTFVKNVNPYVQEDQNYIQITPKTILNMVDLKVVLAK